MGRADKAAKLFYSKPMNFISVVNLVYGEEAASQETEDMREGLLAYVEEMLGYEANRREFKGVFERNRDAVKKIRIDNQSVILGIENQMKPDYSEPVRVMLYDAMSYEEQCRLIRWMHRNKKDSKSDEYVAGFSKGDRVIPVTTIVIYYGEDEWNFPQKLSDICQVEENEILKDCIQDYKIKLIDVRRLSDEQIDSLSSEVKLLFGCVKYSKNTKKLREFIERDRARFEKLSQETYEMIAMMTQTNKLIKEMEKVEKGGQYNMCKAIDDMIEEGRQEERCINIRHIMKSLNIAAQEAMKILCIPQNEYEMYIKLLEK